MRLFLRHILLLAAFFVATSSAQAQIASQGFEPGVAGTWSFTSTPAKYNVPSLTDTWSDTTVLAGPITPVVGNGAWLGRDLTGPSTGDLQIWHYLDFAPIDVSTQTGVTVSFQYAVTAYDAGDSAAYSVSYDNGTTWSNQVTLIAGASGGVSSPAGWSTVTIDVPAGSSFVRLRLAAKQNGNDDWVQFDDVRLNAAAASDVTPPTVLTATNNGANTITLTFSEAVSAATAGDAANYTGVAGLTSVVQSNPTTVILTFSSLPINVSNTLTVNNIADLAGNVLIAPYAYTFSINASLPNLVFSEIMYNDPSSGVDSLEFIEIYNAGTSAQNVGGLVFSGTGIPAFTLPSVNVNAGGTFLLAFDAVKASAFFGQTFTDWGTTNLGNGGGSIMLRNSAGQTIDSVAYDDEGLWPLSPDGNGNSLVLLNPANDNNVASNWAAATALTYPAVAGLPVIANPGVFGAVTTISLTVSTLAVSVAENGSTATFNVVPSGAPAVAVTVNLSAAAGSTAVAGTDYTLSTTSITIPAGSSAAVPVTVNIIDNADAFGGKFVAFDLTSPVNATLGANKQVLVMISDNDLIAPAAPANPGIALSFLSSYQVGAGKSAEISAYDKASKRFFVSNSVTNTLEILDASNPSALTTVNTISLNAYGGMINSVACHNGIVAVAVENLAADLPGEVVFFNTSGTFISEVTVGVLPDHVVFSPNGQKVLTANEAQPLVNYTADPVGSVSVIDISGGVAGLTNANVTTAGFTAFNSQLADLKAAGVRIFGPAGTVAQDMEPEYITFSPDGTKAYVTCQENNAIAIVDVATATITDIKPLGYKDHSLSANTIDASDQSPAQFQATWPVRGMYLPDAIAEFTIAGTSYLITANEGDARADYGAPNEETRVASLTLDPTAYPNGALLKNNRLLGRVRCTNATGDTDGDGDIDMIHTFGGRSFTIWNATTGSLVFDSGNQLELITGQTSPWNAIFNANHDSNTPRTRSDDKGPEPEGVAVAVINGTTYGFIALERVGGVMVYNLNNPAAPQFVQYINNRNTAGAVGPDLGAEGIIYISATDSPNGQPLIAVSNEISGTLALYVVGINCDGIAGADAIDSLFVDADSDGFGTGALVNIGCPTAGFANQGGDCNDNFPSVNPSVSEICKNNIDDNCNGITDTDLDVCDAPSGLGVSLLGLNSATVIFSAGPCYTNLRFRTRTNLGGGVFGPWSAFTAIAPNATLANITGLQPLTRYQFQIQGTCSPTLSSGFGIISFVTLGTLYVDADGDGFGDPNSEVLLTDGLVPGYSTNNLDCNDSNANISPNAQELSSNGIDDDCDGLVDDICALATDFKATILSPTSVLLTWSSSPNLVSYTVRYKTLAAANFTTVTTTTPSLIITGLLPNTNYFYLVKTNCKFSVSTAETGVQSFTTSSDIICDRPVLGATLQLSTTSQHVYWNFQAGTLTKSQIRYRIAGTTNAWTIKTISGTTNNIVLTGLTAGTTYNYQVRAFCGGTWTQFSPNGTFTTLNTGVQALTIAESIDPILSVYPNPTSDYLFIEMLNIAPKQVNIMDAAGATLKTLRFDEAKSGIDVQGLANGPYFIQVIDENGSRYTKLFVKASF